MTKTIIKLKPALLIMMSALFLGCESHIEKSENIFEYPLQTGNYWHYSCVNYMYNKNMYGIPPDSSRDTMWWGDNYIRITGVDTLYDSIEVKVVHNVNSVHIAYRDTFQISEGYGYYRNNNNGLFEYGYWLNNLNYAIPNYHEPNLRLELDPYEFTAAGKICIGPISFTSSKPIDSILHLNNPPFKSLEYPLLVGSEWDCGNEYGFITSHKKVIGREPVETPAGTFDCYKIDRKDYFNNSPSPIDNREQIDYMADIGLVMRVITDSISIRYNQYGDSVGYCNYKIEVLLIEYGPQ